MTVALPPTRFTLSGTALTINRAGHILRREFACARKMTSNLGQWQLLFCWPPFVQGERIGGAR